MDRRHDPVLSVATFEGAASMLLSVTGFLRWVFVVPPLAKSYVDGDAAAADAWTAQHQFGGALSTAIPSFPVWDLGGVVGVYLWGLWVVVLGVAVLRRRAAH